MVQPSLSFNSSAANSVAFPDTRTSSSRLQTVLACSWCQIDASEWTQGVIAKGGFNYTLKGDVAGKEGALEHFLRDTEGLKLTADREKPLRS